jgi:hypothetical protein
MDALMLLDRAAEAGLTVSIGPADKLIVRGPRKAEETAKAILAAKAEVIPAYWRRLYQERMKEATVSKRDSPARWAWEGVAAVWHRDHGDHPPPQICAGCGQPISGSPAMPVIPDNSRVHVDDAYNCLILYGEKWRTAAAVALARYGVPRPRSD